MVEGDMVLTGKVPDDKICVMVKMLGKTAGFFKSVLDVLLPPACYVCGKSCSSEYGLCDLCLDKIRYVRSPGECLAEKTHLEKGWSCCYYKDTMKDCIHLFKYKGYLGLKDIFVNIMADFVKKNELLKNADLIVPVPMHPAKRRGRPYNHAEVLASSLAGVLGRLFDLRNLKKIKWTQSQSELDRGKRLKNVRGSFLAVDKDAFRGKNVLLVDDVYTTGATINECAGALLSAGAKKVFSLTLARGVYSQPCTK